MNRKGFLTRLLAGAFALPAVAKMELVSSVPDKQYADGLLGRLQETRDEYDAAFPEPARYFFCSKLTFDMLYKEVVGNVKRGPSLGMTVYQFEGLTWIHKETTPWGLFEVDSWPRSQYMPVRSFNITQDLMDKMKPPERGEFDKLLKQTYAEMRAKGMI